MIDYIKKNFVVISLGVLLIERIINYAVLIAVKSDILFAIDYIKQLLWSQ